jgi:hypothetical protein
LTKASNTLLKKVSLHYYFYTKLNFLADTWLIHTSIKNGLFIPKFIFLLRTTPFWIRFGGLGIRRISDICLPAFLPSIHGVKKLVSLLLSSKDNEVIIHHYDEALAVWDVENENERPTIPQF